MEIVRPPLPIAAGRGSDRQFLRRHNHLHKFGRDFTCSCGMTKDAYWMTGSDEQRPCPNAVGNDIEYALKLDRVQHAIGEQPVHNPNGFEAVEQPGKLVRAADDPWSPEDTEMARRTFSLLAGLIAATVICNVLPVYSTIVAVQAAIWGWLSMLTAWHVLVGSLVVFLAIAAFFVPSEY